MFFLRRFTSLITLLAVATSFAKSQDGGDAYDMDGADDEVSIPYNAAYDVASFTLEAWVEVDTIPSPEMDALASVVNRWTNDPATEVFGLWIQDAGEGCLSPFIAVGGVDNNGFAAGCFEAGAWHHIAAVYDQAAGEERLYIDGAIVGTDSAGGAPTMSVVDMALGMQVEGPARLFDGRLDEVRVWNVARRDEEIAGSYASCVGPDEAGLIGYWRVDDDEAQVAADNSVTANDGVLGADANVASDDPLRIASAAGVACPDADGDGVHDPFDNCPDDLNEDQSDLDGDGLGDACDPYPDDPDNLAACLAELEAGVCPGLEQCEADLASCETDLATCDADLATCEADLAEMEAGLIEIRRLLSLPPGRRSSDFSCSGSGCPLIMEVIAQLTGPPGQSIRRGPPTENHSEADRRSPREFLNRPDRNERR